MAADYERMGDPLGSVFEALSNEVTWLHFEWAQYRTLYVEDRGVVELLNNTARVFFGLVQHLLRRGVFLNIARLTDPAQQGRYQNLSIRALPGLISDCRLRDEVEAQVDATCRMAEGVRRHRDKRLAHLDRMDALKAESESTLEDIPVAEVDNIVKAIGTTLNTVQAHYCHNETAYGSFVEPVEDANLLLFHLGYEWNGHS